MTSASEHAYSCGVLTLSDKGSRGEREDTSGPLIKELLKSAGFKVLAYRIIADQEQLIKNTLIE